MSVSNLSFSPSHKNRLLKAGFRLAKDVIATSPIQLAKELKVSNEEALEIIEAVKQLTESATVSSSQTALELLEYEKLKRPLITFCSSIDEMLGGGIPLNKLTEFCGAPGIGKTQLGIQLAVNVQIPKDLQGLDGEAVYIDTEGSFIVERVIEIAQGMIDRIAQEENFQNQDLGNQKKHSQQQKNSNEIHNLTVEGILSRIHYFRVHDYIEEIALLNTLEEFINSHPNVKVIIIDSIAFHFRHDFSDMSLRTRLLNGIAQQLMKLAEEFNLAVVLMNQMTTKIQTNEAYRDQSILTPALGESWGHACTNRVILFWQDGQRHAQLFKSPSEKEKTVKYRITQNGTQDLEGVNTNKRKRFHSSLASVPSKRS